MKLHDLKIEYEFGMEKHYGRKLFEIRENDRDFQEGDIVIYTLLGDDGKPFKISHDILKTQVYLITYVTDYKQKPGYVVFGEKPLKGES